MQPKKPSDPKELVPGQLKWVSRSFYGDIGKLQADLNPVERKLLVDQLATSLDQYEHMALNIKAVRNILYRVFNRMMKTGVIASQLSRKFNMSIPGHNEQVTEDIENAFNDAHERERENCPFEAARILRAATLSHKQLFASDVIDAVVMDNGGAAVELIRVRQYQNRLFRSTLKMAVRIARKHDKHLDGNTVEWQDLAQEAVIAAQQAVESYRPIEGGNTFTSFVHTWVSGSLSKKVNETTRTVFIPRSTLDRFGYISKAIDELDLLIEDLRGGAWVDGKIYDGKVDYDTLGKIAARATELQQCDKAFTPEEVHDLILTTQQEVSMDLKIEGDDTGINSMTFGDSIASDKPPAGEALDGGLFSRRLMGIMAEFTSTEEYALLELRWGMGAVKSYKTAAEEYSAGTGKPMNKGKAALLEQQVFTRVQREAANNPDLMKRFRELMETSLFITEK